MVVMCDINYFPENEKHVAEDQGKIDGLKDELRDKSARVNELEVSLEKSEEIFLLFVGTASYEYFCKAVSRALHLTNSSNRYSQHFISRRT